ncbi:MAG: hypothetical protein VCC99_13095 [Alphaproteobacteria bacterium]
MITELSRFDGLFVIARNSTFQLKGRGVDIAEVGRRFGVRYVVEGSVRRAGNRVRISAQLTDVAGANHLWAERYDRDLTDVFAVQDDVTSQIIAALGAELGAAARPQPRRQVTENIEAYDLYLRGRAYVERTTPEANRRAREMFERAIALDDGCAEAFSELAMAKFRDWVFGWDSTPDLLDQAPDAASEGIARDDTLAAAHTRFAWVELWRRNHDTAIVAPRRAVALDTNYAEGHSLLAGILAFSSETDDVTEAVASANAAARLDPYSFTAAFHRGVANFVANRHEDAMEGCRASLQINPDFLGGHLFLAALLGLSGNVSEAKVEADEIRRLTADLEAIFHRLPFRDATLSDRLVRGLRQAGFELADPPETGG